MSVTVPPPKWEPQTIPPRDHSGMELSETHVPMVSSPDLRQAQPCRHDMELKQGAREQMAHSAGCVEMKAAAEIAAMRSRVVGFMSWFLSGLSSGYTDPRSARADFLFLVRYFSLCRSRFRGSESPQATLARGLVHRVLRAPGLSCDGASPAPFGSSPVGGASRLSWPS